jgi:hypothetical protein
MRGQRYSRHVKNCWRHFLQTRNSRRRFQVAIASKIYPAFATFTKNTGVHPVRIAIPKMGKQLSSPFVCYHPAAHFATEVSWVSQAGFMSQAGRLHEL